MDADKYYKSNEEYVDHLLVIKQRYVDCLAKSTSSNNSNALISVYTNLRYIDSELDYLKNKYPELFL